MTKFVMKNAAAQPCTGKSLSGKLWDPNSLEILHEKQKTTPLSEEGLDRNYILLGLNIITINLKLFDMQVCSYDK